MSSRWLLRVLLGVISLLTVSSFAWAKSEEDELFDRLLKKPDDPALNLAFARVAEKSGELRHALAALERARNADPNNAEIAAEYERVRLGLLPAITVGTFQLGGSWATNPLQLPRSETKVSDYAADASLSITDERTIAGFRLRSQVSAAGQWQRSLNEIDTGRVSIASGPVFTLHDDLWVHTAPNVSQVWIDGTRLYDEAGFTATFGKVINGLTQTMTAHYGWRRGNDDILFSDSQVSSLDFKLSASPNVVAGDVFYFQPGVHVNQTIHPFPNTVAVTNLGAIARDISPDSYIEGGARVSYFVPLAGGSVYIGAGMSVYKRNYDSFTLDPNQLAQGIPVFTNTKRRDLYLEPTAHVILPRLIAPNLDLRFDYRFENNHSNDDSREFNNQVVGFTIVGSF